MRLKTQGEFKIKCQLWKMFSPNALRGVSNILSFSLFNLSLSSRTTVQFSLKTVTQWDSTLTGRLISLSVSSFTFFLFLIKQTCAHHGVVTVRKKFKCSAWIWLLYITFICHSCFNLYNLRLFFLIKPTKKLKCVFMLNTQICINTT